MPPAGLGLDRDRWLYLVALVALLIAMRVAANMLHGRTGRALVAIRDHPIAASRHGHQYCALQDARLRHVTRCSPASRVRWPQSSSAMCRPRVTASSCRFRSWSARRSAALRPSAARLSVVSSSSSCPISPTTSPTPRHGRSTDLAMLLFMYSMPRGVVGSLRPWINRTLQRIMPHRAAFDDGAKELMGGRHGGEAST